MIINSEFQSIFNKIITSPFHGLNNYVPIITVSKIGNTLKIIFMWLAPY